MLSPTVRARPGRAARASTPSPGGQRCPGVSRSRPATPRRKTGRTGATMTRAVTSARPALSRAAASGAPYRSDVLVAVMRYMKALTARRVARPPGWSREAGPSPAAAPTAGGQRQEGAGGGRGHRGQEDEGGVGLQRGDRPQQAGQAHVAPVAGGVGGILGDVEAVDPEDVLDAVPLGGKPGGGGQPDDQRRSENDPGRPDPGAVGDHASPAVSSRASIASG